MRHVPRIIALVVLVASACGDPSGPGAPQSIAILAGDDQSTTVGSAFAQPIVVTVLDASKRAVPGVDISWSVESGGGTIDRPATTTDRDGRASVRWTAGTVAGLQRLRASADGVGSVALELAAAAGSPVMMHPLSGGVLLAEPGAGVPGPLVVLLRDAYGNPVPRQPVRFTASAGAVSDTLILTSTACGTGPGVCGTASTHWTLGAAGEQSVTVTVPGTNLTTTFIGWAVAREDVPVLESGVPVEGLAAPAGTPRLYRIPVFAGTARLTVSANGPNGDADLYLRNGGYPSESLHHCASGTPVSAEQCLVRNPEPGDWFVLVDAWSEYSGLTLRGEWLVGGQILVTIDGVQSGLADVLMSGPHGFQRTIEGTSLLGYFDPGTYTLTANHVKDRELVYVAAPAVQEVEIRSNERVEARIVYAVSSGPLNLDVLGAHITQSVQRPDGSVALVAGRDALLRVFARANATTDERPPVRVRIYHDGVLVDTRTAAAPGAGVPVSPDMESLAGTWNVGIPGALIRSGLSFTVDIDPENLVAEASEDDNSYPAGGAHATPEVRAAAPFLGRLVPVVQSANGLVGDVSAANLGSYVNRTYAVYPLDVMDVDVREPYTFTGALAPQYDSTWNRLLQEVAALRMTDANDRYYYGVIKPAYTSGGTGYGYVGYPAAVGIDWSPLRHETLAHEWGHNFGRLHVDCGGPASPDPGYPYPDGGLAQPGWDVRTGTLHSSVDRYDLMSYCEPTWSSDYTYEAVMAYREAEATAAAAPEAALVVWGRITSDGVVLEPAFETVTRPLLPRRGGRYTLTIADADGSTVGTFRFDGVAIDHEPDARQFLYALPLRMLRGATPAEIRLSGAGADVVRAASGSTGVTADMEVTRVDGAHVRVRWDAARSPLAVVRDARTGAVLSFARGGHALVRTDDAELQVELSDGVRSHVRRRVIAQ